MKIEIQFILLPGKIFRRHAARRMKISYLPVMTTLRGPALQCSSRTLFAPIIVPIITPPSQLYQISSFIWLSPPKGEQKVVWLIKWNFRKDQCEMKREAESRGSAIKVYGKPDSWNPTPSTTPLLIIVIAYLPSWVATWEKVIEISKHIRNPVAQEKWSNKMRSPLLIWFIASLNHMSGF